MSAKNMRSIEIEWPGLEVKVEAQLLDDKAPGTCNAIWNRLPFQSVQDHALSAGQIILCSSPIVVPFRENPRPFELGNVWYAADSTDIAIVYGDVTEPATVPTFATVRQQDVNRLKIAGQRTWENLCHPYASTIWAPYRKSPINVVFRRGSSIGH